MPTHRVVKQTIEKISTKTGQKTNILRSYKATLIEAVLLEYDMLQCQQEVHKNARRTFEV